MPYHLKLLFEKQTGMASGLETLCGQAYGAQQYQNLGLNTAIFCLLLVSLPISLLWASMGKLLHFMGQDPIISYQAGKYAMRRILGLFANDIVLPLMKFLLAQNFVLPMVFSTCVGFLSACVGCLPECVRVKKKKKPYLNPFEWGELESLIKAVNEPSSSLSSTS